MFCRDCGKQLAEGAQFCDGCGARQQAAEQTAAPEPKAKLPKRTMLTAVVVVLILLIVGAVGAWAVFLKPMGVAEYKREVTQNAIAAAKTMGEWQQDTGSVDVSWDDNPVGEDSLQALRTPTKSTLGKIERLRNELAKMRPPVQYKDEHAQLLDGYESFNDALASLSSMLTKMTGDDSLNSGAEMVPTAAGFPKDIENGSADMQEALKALDLWDAVDKAIAE